MACAVLALCTCGCMRNLVEQKIAERLPDLIGPARRYSVNLGTTSTLQLLQGNIKQIHISGDRVKIKHNPVINRLDITSRDISYHKKLRHIGQTEFQAQILESDLNAYLSGKDLPLKQPRIILREQGLTLQGNYPLILQQMLPVSLEGNLQLQERTRINLIIDRLKIAGIGVPSFVIAVLEQKLNPLADLRTSQLPLLINRITLASGNLELDGEARLDPAKD